MTIRDDDELKAALKWPVTYGKTTTRVSVALLMSSVFDIAGVPGAGTLAVGNTANGLSHTKATLGYPSFPNAPAGKGWYLALAEGQSSVAGQRDLYDFIYSQGANAFNANQAITTQPSIDDRLRVAPAWAASTVFRAGDLATNDSAPIKAYICTVGGTSADSGGPATTANGIADGTCTWNYLFNGLNYSNLELLVEQVTAATGVQTVTGTYSTMANDGVTLTAGRSTGAIAFPAAPIVGRMMRMPLQAGDKNIALLTNVLGTIATAGTFNIHLARKIVGTSAYVSPFAFEKGYDRTGLAYIPNNAALRELHTPASTATMTIPNQYTLALG